MTINGLELLGLFTEFGMAEYRIWKLGDGGLGDFHLGLEKPGPLVLFFFKMNFFCRNQYLEKIFPPSSFPPVF